MTALFLNQYLKLLLILTPFFVLSVFLSVTRSLTLVERRKTAVKVTVAVIMISFFLFFFGRHLFDLFGITLDAFRIGAGAVLFLSALSLIRGSTDVFADGCTTDIAVVPLAIPVTVGPGTIGALLVMGAVKAPVADKLVGCAALLSAVLTVGLLLYVATTVEKLIGQKGLVIMTKLVGLFLSALAAQIMFTGIRNFLQV